MDWLMHNFIADMYGPNFLMFYAVANVLALFVCWTACRRAARVEASVFPTLPAQPDPLEIAYLRGGERGVVEVIVLSLIQRGVLESSGRYSIKIRQKLNRAGQDTLSEAERMVFAGFDSPRSIKQMLALYGGDIKRICGEYASTLRGNGLLVPEEAPGRIRRAKWIAYAFVLGLGGYKLAVALSRGRTNVLFLILMGIVFLFVIHQQCKTPRLSSRGEEVLRDLRTSLAPKGTRAALTGVDRSEGAALLLLGLFGVEALAGTAYGDMLPVLRSSHFAPGSGGTDSTTTDSSSSGGCGGSDGGGGGGGSGCGGCGGGGGE